MLWATLYNSIEDIIWYHYLLAIYWFKFVWRTCSFSTKHMQPLNTTQFESNIHSLCQDQSCGTTQLCPAFKPISFEIANGSIDGWSRGSQLETLVISGDRIISVAGASTWPRALLRCSWLCSPSKEDAPSTETPESLVGEWFVRYNILAWGSLYSNFNWYGLAV